MFACWHDWKGGLSFATRMLSEGYPLWMPLVLVGWMEVRHLRRARWCVVVAGSYSVLYQLVNIAVFDQVATQPFLYETAFGREHGRWYPWRPDEHFFVLYVVHYGPLATLKSISWTFAQFLLCSAAVIFGLRPVW